MAKIFKGVEGVEVPKFNPDWDQGLKDNEKYVQTVQALALENNPTDKYAGLEYRIPHGDGYARYVVLSSKPVQMVHLAIGDAWHSPWVNKVTKKDIVEYVKREEAISKIFGKSA